MIAFSVGHKGKKTRPNDRGAPVVGGGMEADYAEKVLEKAKVVLEGISAIKKDREIAVKKGEQVLWKQDIDEDAEVTWNPMLGVLRIEED